MIRGWYNNREVENSISDSNPGTPDMIRSTLYILFTLCLCQSTLADDATLKEAKKLRLRGNYEEAIELYEKLAKKAETEVVATIGQSKVMQSQGEYDKALDLIDSQLKKHSKNADLLGRRAELLLLRGRWDDAMQAAEAALKEKSDQFNARWVRAQLYRDKGEIKKADQEFRWFVRTYVARSNADMDIKDPEALLLVGLAGCENARWYSLSDQFEFILQEVYSDAIKYDSNYWPAEYEAGMLLLEKYNRGEALDALDKALTINPVASEALVGKGMAALQRLEYKDALKYAERALRENPKLTSALRLVADIHLASGDIDKAMKELESARKVNPREEATLGRMAVCYLLQKKQKEYDALVKEVEKHNKLPGEFYLVMGEAMDSRKHYEQAEKFLAKATELRKFLTSGVASLGLLYMRMGKEKEAAPLLKKAFESDPFNVRVSNMRKVLRHLENYKTIETKHFALRYDPDNDAALARYLAEFLEDYYDNLAEQFQHKPKGPILIEVFNNHQMFSGRTIALPDLHTIGACTGRMVAMVSPQGRGVRKPFNWARVMRHELVHIFNLDQTNFLVPHWFTEGLAVMNEGFPRPQTWNKLLRERVPKGDLYNLETIDLGFIRPRNALDWNMAYCQSLLYVLYMKRAYGDNSIGGMLNAFRDGMSSASAIQKVCKVDKDTFEKGYKKYLEEVVKSIKGQAEAKAMTFRELKKAHEDNPNDPDLMARLAEYHLLRNRMKARELADEALQRKKEHPLASYVRARLYLLAGESRRALDLLVRAVDKDKPEPKVLRLLGKMYYEARELSKAADIFELGRKAEPYENYWLMQLARVYALAEKKDKQIDILKALVPTDADDLDNRKRLARLLLEEKQFVEAEKYA